MTTQTVKTEPDFRVCVTAFEAGRRMVEAGEIDLDRLAGLVCTADDTPLVYHHVCRMLPALVARYGETVALRKAGEWAAVARKAVVRSARRKH